MNSKRLFILLGILALTAALVLSAVRSAPTYAANGTVGNTATTLQLAPPPQNPTLIPQTTPGAGGFPPIDLGSLLGDTPTPTAVSGEGVTNPVLENDFAECPPIDDEFLLIECKNGELNFTRKETAGTRYIYYRPVLTDAVIEVTTRMPSQKNGRYGVIFRLSEDFKNYYVLGVTNKGQYGLFRFVDGQYETIIPYTESLFVGNASFPSKIRVVNQGDTIAINIGGDWLDSVRDPNLTSGRVALFFEPDEANQTVLFDNLRVEEILSPLPVPQPRVVQPAVTPTDDIPIINFGTTATPNAPQPTQTPFIIVVTATPAPATATSVPTNVPTRAPTRRPTEASCAAGANEVLFYISNNYPNTTMRFTIGGGEWGTHDYDVPGDGKYYIIKMPPGKYTYSAFIPGQGKASGERTEYKAGQCYSLRFSP